MRNLTLNEINSVNGGDSWAGTPEGRAPGSDEQAGQVFCNYAGSMVGNVVGGAAGLVVAVVTKSPTLGRIAQTMASSPLGDAASDACNSLRGSPNSPLTIEDNRIGQ